MRLIKIVLGLLVALAALAASLVIILPLVDLSVFRGQLESLASEAFDRRVTFAGTVRIKPGLRPQLVVEDMRIANPDWASRPLFAQVQRLELRIALLPLLRREIDVLDVVFKGADVMLEVGTDDRNNFTFGRRVGPPELPDIHQFTVLESVVALRDPEGEPNRCAVVEFEATSIPGQPIAVAGRLICRDVPLQLSLSAGTPEEFESPTSPWPMNFSARTADASLAIQGLLPKPRLWKGSEFQISARGDKVDSLEQLFDVALPANGSFELFAAVRRSEDVYAVSELQARIGATDLAGEFTWEESGAQPVLTGSLVSRSMRLKDFYTGDDEASANDSRPPLLDRPLPFDWLTALDATLALEVELFADAPLALRNTAVTATLSGGTLTLSELRTTVLETPVTGHLAVSQVEDAADIRVDLLAARLDLGQVLSDLKPDWSLAGTVNDLSLAAQGHGRTLRALLQSARLKLGTKTADIKSAQQGTTEAWKLHIAAIELDALKAQSTRISVDGEFRGVPLALLAETLPLVELASLRESWPLSINARTGDAKLIADGTVLRQRDGTTIELKGMLEGKRLSSLNPLLAASLPDTGPYRLSAALSKSADIYTVTGLKGKIGVTDIAGELQWSQAEERPLLEGKLVSHSLRAEDLVVTADPPQAEKRLPDALDRPISLDWLTKTDAELELEIRRVVDTPVPLRNVTATARLLGGRLTLSPAGATLAGIPLQGSLTVSRGDDGADIGLTARADGVDLGELLDQLESKAALRGHANGVTLAMTSRGQTMRALLQGADLSLQTQRTLLTVAEQQAKEPWQFDISAATLSTRPALPVTITVDGEYRSKPFALSMDTIGLEGLLTGKRPWPITVSLNATEAKLEASGTVSQPFQGKGFDLAVKITGKDFKKLDPLIDYVIPLRGEFQIAGRFSDRPDGYDFRDLKVNVGQSDLQGTVLFVTGEPRTRISASIHSRQLDYDDLEFVESVPAAADRQRLIPEYPLPVEALLAVNLDVDLQAEKIRTRGGDLGDLVLTASVQNGVSATLARVTNDIGGQLTAEHRVDVTVEPPVNSFRLTARGLNYGLLLTSAEVAEFAEGTVDVDIALAGPGATQRSFLAQADGRITVTGGPGRIASRQYGLWSSDLVVTMLTAGWRREAVTEINCIVGRVDVEDGVATTDKLLLDTARLTIAGSGALDLETEEIDFLLSPRPKQARLVSVANPVRVTGTLLAPDVQVTVLPRGRRAATGLLAGLLNPALLVVSFSDLGAGGGNACVAAMDKLEAGDAE